MKKQLKKLEDFQKAFNSPFNDKPSLVSEENYQLRYKLLEEENKEYLGACIEGDLTEIADAIGDQLYLVMGNAVVHGLQNHLAKIFNEIHDSNMSKLDENGNPIINGENGAFNRDKPLGKVLKSKQYFEPNLKQILER